jgi:putative transcriptional regulator
MARRKTSFGKTLIAAAREAVDIEKGRLTPARVTRYNVADTKVDEPPRYSAKRITMIRVRMELSQPLFAAALNVSPETIRAWEQGKREPAGPTLRLLELAEEHPDVFLEKLHGPSAARSRAS